MFTPPAEVEAVLAPFAALFTRPSWQRAQALLCGMLLAPANCVITAALRVLGLSADAHFQNYHRVLNRARWSAHHAAGILLRLLVKAFVPTGPVVIGLDDTVERRRGAKIAGRSMYRDAVRSSWGCFQKTSGLRWIGLHLITRVPWAKRTWALPFLTSESQPIFGTKYENQDDFWLDGFFTHSSASRAAGHEFLKRRDARTEDRDIPANDKVAPAQIAAIQEWSEPVGERFNYLRDIKQPVLVVNGTHDIIYYSANSLPLAQNFPNGQLILYPDAAHGSFFQYPGLFVEDATRFLHA